MKNLNLKTITAFAIFSLLSSNFNISNAGCVSGGPGATQCSLSYEVGPVSVSVSVSCGAGTYACCNPGGASCKEEPKPESIN